MKKQLAAIIIQVITAFLVGRYNGARGHNPRTTARRILYYVDPMHPGYRSNQAGIAPDCGMALEPVYEGEDPTAKLQLAPDAIMISSERQQLIGVNVEAVQRNSGTRLMRTTGRVEADESRVHRVMSGTEGWVQSIENYPAGSLVKQNQLLATLYSKEFRNAEQAYIGSATSLDRLKAPRSGRPQPHQRCQLADQRGAVACSGHGRATNQRTGENASGYPRRNRLLSHRRHCPLPQHHSRPAF